MPMLKTIDLMPARIPYMPLAVYPLPKLRGLVDDILRLVPANEQIDMKIRMSVESIKYQHELSPLEAAEHRATEAEAEAKRLRDGLRGLLHPDGTLVADAAERLARIAERIGA